MSIKNNLNYIKNEFSNDEKIIENAFKLEILYKRYKYIIWTFGVIIIAILLFVSIRSYYIENNAVKSSSILNSLLENPNDTELKEELKNSNKNLYNIFVLKQALNKGNIKDLEYISNNSNDDFIKYIANYHLGSFERDSNMLSKDTKFMIGDFAKIQNAYILIDNNKVSQAQDILRQIAENSQLKELSNILLHYTIMKDKK
ncbi:hypothetical protein [Helicobacter sp. MIT 14-3879]|uniref:hypothetical protein n=1 Tax=Helicobacter sp. MIT 14-3879 TaxID=2040649 RepID=UPI000E1F1AF8|nr:hypothetical protein [Helicobacter sp. MIT 14-3879]RDU64805.1 hypothetical protein CQA44_03600 [Helicobacter sp. MIT 14-3879]